MMTYNIVSVDLSIIIISYNTKDITEKCIRMVMASLNRDPDIKAEIIVLDNNSTDGSVEMLEKLGKEIRLIKSKENLGFARGNNRAVKDATGKYLMFLNSDTEAVENAVPQLYRLFHDNKHGFDAAGGKLLNTDGTLQASAGRFYTLPVAFAALFLKADSWGLSRSSPSRAKEIDWVSGACFIIRKSNFERLGGFDEAIFMYWDEVDFFYRARQKGLTVGFFPEPTFIHHEGASSNSRTQPILNVYTGYRHFYKKHYSPVHLKILRDMLQLKAVLSVVIGKLTGNRYLVETYSQAYEIAKKN